MSNQVISRIIDIVTLHTGVTYQEMHDKSRKRHIVNARQCAMWLIRKYSPQTTLKRIGSIFGGRDHATVIHSMDAVEDQIYCNNSDFTWVNRNDVVLSIKNAMSQVDSDSNALGKKRIRMTIEVVLEDAFLMSDEEEQMWFEKEVLSGNGSLILHSNEVGDYVGVVDSVSDIAYFPYFDR